LLAQTLNYIFAVLRLSCLGLEPIQWAIVLLLLFGKNFTVKQQKQGNTHHSTATIQDIHIVIPVDSLLLRSLKSI